MIRLSSIAKVSFATATAVMLCAGDPPPLTAHGLGALRIGMPWREARALVGPVTSTPPDSESCREYVAKDAPGMVIMVENNRVSRIAVWKGSAVQTDVGLVVGSSERSVRRAYPRALKVETAAYGEEPAHFLTHWEPGGRFGIKYETNTKGVVTAIYAGTRSILAIEGCL